MHEHEHVQGLMQGALPAGRSGTTGIRRLGSVPRRLATHVPGGFVVVPPA